MTATITATMTPLAASSAVRLPVARQRRRAGWPVVLSVLLHVALLALAIVAARHKRNMPHYAPPAPIAMVFQGGGNTSPSIANPAPMAPNQPASPAPQPSTPSPPLPTPPVETPPQPPKAPPAETPPPPEVVPQPKAVVPPTPEIAPPVPEAAPPKEAAPPVQQEALPPPPAPAPKATPRPMPEIVAPPTAAPSAQAPAPEALPLPPPVPIPAPKATPQPAPPRPPLPREAERPAPPRPSPAFPAPMNFSLGPTAEAPNPAVPRQRASRPAIDLSFAPSSGGGQITQLHPYGKGEEIGADWANLLSEWWVHHRYYPEEAARLDQQGEVTLSLVVDHDGRVESVNVQKSSGSPWIDMGALQTLKGAHLPPLPKDFHDPKLFLNYHLYYILIP